MAATGEAASAAEAAGSAAHEEEEREGEEVSMAGLLEEVDSEGAMAAASEGVEEKVKLGLGSLVAPVGAGSEGWMAKEEAPVGAQVEGWKAAHAYKPCCSSPQR